MKAIALALLVLVPTVALSQKEGRVTCRFIAMKGAKPPAMINVGPGDFEVEVTMRSNILSQDVICAKQGNNLHFATTGDGKPAAVVAIPNNVRNAILVFGRAANEPGKLPWRVFVIEDSPKKFPHSGAFVANFHNQAIRFIIGEEKAMLKPAGSHGFPRPDKRDNFNMAPVVFQFQNNKDEWITASETMLRFIPGLRYLMFAYVDPISRRPSVTTVKDFKLPDPPTAKK